jgi:ribonuclease HII
VIPDSITAAIDAADYVVGSDEVGYGAWAGPLVVCAVVISKNWPLAHLVKDSKAFTGKNAHSHREKIAKQILTAVTYTIVSVPPEQIDDAGVYKLLPILHGRAIDAVIAKHAALGVVGTNAVIVDGTLKVFYGNGEQALSLPKADSLIPAVSAASIIGKVARDLTMVKLSKEYPGYGFENHRGYGGDENHAHSIALRRLGPCAIHRKSYGPIRDLLKKEDDGHFDFSTLGGDED